jgi:adenosylcobinamide-phosphate synthase
MSGWLFGAATVALAGVFDVAFGEPPNALHPVAWMGRLIALLERHRPRGRPQAELAYGALIVLVACGVAGGVGVRASAGRRMRCPGGLALPLGALALKIAFSLRGLAAAGRTVQRRLGTDIVAARAGADWRWSAVTRIWSRRRSCRRRSNRWPRTSPTASSRLSSTSPSSVCRGRSMYRAVNTMDAMIGYHGELEYVGKAAARLDDARQLAAGPALGAAASGGGLACGGRPRRRGRRCARSAAHLRGRTSSGRSPPWPAPSACSSRSAASTPSARASGRWRRPVIGEAIAVLWVAGAVSLWRRQPAFPH